MSIGCAGADFEGAEGDPSKLDSSYPTCLPQYDMLSKKIYRDIRSKDTNINSISMHFTQPRVLYPCLAGVRYVDCRTACRFTWFLKFLIFVIKGEKGGIMNTFSIISMVCTPSSNQQNLMIWMGSALFIRFIRWNRTRKLCFYVHSMSWSLQTERRLYPSMMSGLLWFQFPKQIMTGQSDAPPTNVNMGHWPSETFFYKSAP